MALPSGPFLAPGAGEKLSARVDSSGDYFSPFSLASAPDGNRLYVAGATARHVTAVNPVTGKVIMTFQLPSSPGGLTLSQDGKRLFVTCGEAAGQVLWLNCNDGAIEGALATGQMPVSPVLSPAGDRLYVCNRFHHSVSVFDLDQRKEMARLRVSREPVAACVTPDGRFLFVANHLPATPSLQSPVAAVISVIDTATLKVIQQIELPNGSTGLRGICVSPDGRQVYITHILARYAMPTTQLDRGWMNTAALSVIDVKALNLVNTVLLDDVDRGAANPWGVACTADGRWIIVGHAGTHELSVIDQPALLDKLAKAARGEQSSTTSMSADDVPNDLSFLVGLRRRLPLAGKGPRALIVTGTKACVTEYFSDSIGMLDVDPGAGSAVQSLALGSPKPLSPARRGELFFNDAALCFQNWQSCATCHPDGRVDGLNWDLLNDGIGNAKNTKTMLLAHRTPPAMSLGIRETGETAVRAGIRHIQFAVRPEEDAAAIDEYLKSLQPVSSPYRVDGQLSGAARRGQRIYERAGCPQCHPAPLFTNLKAYPVGTGSGLEQEAEFDTPALVEAWRTAPYLHDGRAMTVQEVFRKYNPGDRHGRTSHLTAQELDELAAYVLSQ